MFSPKKFMGSLLFFIMIGLWYTAILVDLDLTRWETYVSGACLIAWAVAIYIASRETDKGIAEVKVKWDAVVERWDNVDKTWGDVCHSLDVEASLALQNNPQDFLNVVEHYRIKAGSTEGEEQVAYQKKLDWLESIREEHSLSKDLILQKYSFRVFWGTEDENWIAMSPDFGAGLSAMGDTPTEALRTLRTVIIPMALETMKEDGEEPPIPLTWPERMTDEGDDKKKA